MVCAPRRLQSIRAPLQAAHDEYAAERDAAIPADHVGPRPSGGVGGTRKGVKCLHAHYANFLAGADDPVGAWVASVLASGMCRSGGTADAKTEGTGEEAAS